MSEQHNNTFDIQVKLTILDYFRYHYSLFCLKLSGLFISILSAIVIVKYTSNLVNLIYNAYSSGIFNPGVGRSILINLLVLLVFTAPFVKTFFIAYKDAKNHELLGKTFDVRITRDKFMVAFEGSKQEYCWKKMYKIYNFSHSFAPFIDKKEATFILPKRCFKNKEQIKFLKDIIVKYKK